MTNKGLTVTKMKSEIQRMAKDLGIPPIQFNADRSLNGFRRGAPLTVGELRALPKSAIVWVYYKEHGERGPRVNGPQRASKLDNEDAWDLEDGSSFGGEFRPTGAYDMATGEFATPPDSDECFDEGGGEGEMRLYHAVPKSNPNRKAKSHANPPRRR